NCRYWSADGTGAGARRGPSGQTSSAPGEEGRPVPRGTRLTAHRAGGVRPGYTASVGRRLRGAGSRGRRGRRPPSLASAPGPDPPARTGKMAGLPRPAARSCGHLPLGPPAATPGRALVSIAGSWREVVNAPIFYTEYGPGGASMTESG